MMKRISLIIVSLCVACSAWGAGNDANTILLLHFDGTDDSTNDADFVDSAVGGSHTISQEGNAKLEDTQKKFGTTSLYVDGNGDWVKILDDADLDFGTDDFTIDWWEYRTADHSDKYMGGRSFTDIGVSPYFIGYNEADGSTSFYADSGAGTWDISSSKDCGTMLFNEWVHWAVCRSGENFYLYRNGVASGDSGFTSALGIEASSSDMGLGGGQNGAVYITGYIDEFRISNVARYDGNNFDVETEAYSEDAGGSTFSQSIIMG